MALTTDIRDKDQIRTYNRADSIVFLKTREAFGGLSNMAGGFLLCVNGIDIRTSEALYQACRFPHLPEVQRLIIEQRSPMTAKMKSRKHHQDSRQDWDWIRVKIMRWCLRVKLIQNWDAFSYLLLKTGDQSIVEQSRKDDFWGAKPVDKHTLVGVNALGRLLMGLREEVKNEGQEAFLREKPLDISDFSLGGRPIEPVTAPDRRAVAINAETSEPLSYPAQTSLFQPSVVKEPSPPEYVTENVKNTGISNFEPYSAYKDSGVDWIGEIPAHWEVQKSKHLWQEIEERSKFGNEQLLAVSQYSGITPREEDSRSESLVAYKTCHTNDLVINIMLAWLGGLGVTKQDGIVSPAYCVYRQTQDNDSSYLGYLYRTPIYLAEFARRSTGIVPSRWRMYTEDFGQVLTLLPPKSEQKRIVRFLDQKTAEIDEAIDKNQRLIELLKELKAILINQAVTKGLNPNVLMQDSGVEGLGEVPAHWEVRRLKYATDMRISNVDKHIKEGEEPVRLCNYVDVYNNDYINEQINFMRVTATAEEIERFRLKEGDVLITKDSETWNDIGVPALVIETASDLISGYHLALLSPQANELVGGYLLRALQSKTLAYQFHVEAKGVTRYGLSQDSIKSVWLPIPPFPEQAAIDEYLNEATADIDEAIDEKQRLIELLKELKPVTIVEAVTGKIKV